MASRKIVLMGTPIINEEYGAAEAVTPGHLVKIDVNGVSKNTANGDDVARMFAVERDELGKDIDDAYASGDIVKVASFKPGERVYALLASGQNAAIGDALTGDNAGLLTKTGVADGNRLARALEAVNTTGSAPVAGTRIRAEII